MAISRRQLVIILSAVFVIAAYGTLARVRRFASDVEALQYSPYNFTNRDRAELVVTKFIRAIETGNVKTALMLVEKDTYYGATKEVITEFYRKHCQSKAKKHLILYPQEFIFNNSVVAMRFVMRNTLNAEASKEAMLNLVYKEDQWLIKTSSSFFDVLMLANGTRKAHGDKR